MAALFGVAGACSSWPGVSKDGGNQGGNSTGPDPVIGTCSGTPLPCASLAGGDCTNTSGCMDLGSCSGTPTAPGEACGAEITYQGCAAIAGCVWSPDCTGTPLGTCTGITQTSCLLAKGCAFTPSSSTGSGGAGGAGTTCTSYAATCTSNSSCDCGYTCIQQCATCLSVCAHACQSDLDCTVSQGPSGEATPFCTGVTNPPTALYPGVCAAAR